MNGLMTLLLNYIVQTQDKNGNRSGSSAIPVRPKPLKCWRNSCAVRKTVYVAGQSLDWSIRSQRKLIKFCEKHVTTSWIHPKQRQNYDRNWMSDSVTSSLGKNTRGRRLMLGLTTRCRRRVLDKPMSWLIIRVNFNFKMTRIELWATLSPLAISMAV